MSRPGPSVLVIPFPAQGHVNSLMHFSHKLAQHGFKIIFVNSDFNHKQVLSSRAAEQESLGGSQSQIKLVSIPDGLGSEDDRNNIGKLMRSILCTMPAMLEKLIEDLISSKDSEISCVVADVNMGWALEVARKLGIKGAALWTASAAMFALQYHAPKLIHDGIIDSNGFPTKKRTLQLSPTMPTMETDQFFWTTLGDAESQKIVFDYNKGFKEILDLTEWWLCNTTYELEPGALSYIPKLQPIGPLLEGHNTERSLGQFWKEDMSCLNWLDQQPPCSAIYLAFGSFVVFDSKQFQEIALGLELTNRPFLWVARPETISSIKQAYPAEFKGGLGKIIEWAPQWKVLNHPSIACFISHCGWNSVMDGLCNGVPFLCWPYFADQSYNKTCICDEWKVGLGFDSYKNGFVSRGEIKKKVDQLLGDGDIKARSLKLKEVVMNNIAQDGQSQKKFHEFVKWLKE